MTRTPRHFLCVLLAVSACNSSSDDSDASVDLGDVVDMTVDAGMDATVDAGTDAGADASVVTTGPITAPEETWTWIDFPNSFCDDGSPTGLGVRLDPDSDDVLIFFNGGGACWNYATCVTASTSTHGPYGAPEFAGTAAGLGARTVFDKNDFANPFRNYSMIFVPYCTGDLHAGSVVTTYSDGTASRDIHHVGHANVLAYLERLAATFPAPGNVVVSGGSAGGGGALFNYPAMRTTWPSATMFLIDDALPLLPGDAIPFRAEMFSEWLIGDLIGPLCGEACHTDLSIYMRVLAEAYPGDRMALLSSKQDSVLRAYFQQTPEQFEASLDDLTTHVLDPLPNMRHYYTAGEGHTMLGAPGLIVSNGVNLRSWLNDMVSGDAEWASVSP